MERLSRVARQGHHRGVRVLHLVFSFVADHTPVRPSTSSNSRDTVAGGWSSPTSTLLKNCCITTVSAHSRINQPCVQPNISPLASDGACEGKGELLGTSPYFAPRRLILSPTLQTLRMRSHFPDNPAFDLCQTRFPYPPHLVVSAYQISLTTVWTIPISTHKSVLAHAYQSYHAHPSLP